VSVAVAYTLFIAIPYNKIKIFKMTLTVMAF